MAFYQVFKRILTVLLLIICFLQCKNSDENYIPNTSFDLTIDLRNINSLTVPGNSSKFAEFGYSGVIVYCNQPNEYFAFDATCTVNVELHCSVEPVNFIATCPCCSSKFSLLDGTPLSGPAIHPLRSYSVYKNGERLSIIN